MVERLRKVKVDVEVDTNKRSVGEEFEGEDAGTQAQAWIDSVLEGLSPANEEPGYPEGVKEGQILLARVRVREAFNPDGVAVVQVLGDGTKVHLSAEDMIEPREGDLP